MDRGCWREREREGGVGAVSGWVVMAMRERGRGLVDLGVTEVFPGELGLVPQLLLNPLGVATALLVDLGVTEVASGEPRPSESQLLLNPHQLVVLGQTLRPAGSASLDLSGAQSHHQVRDEGIFSLSGAVAHHHTPAVED